MLAKRIIPCLDVKDGQTVKGVNFINIRRAGDPVELGAAYAEQGADELVFLDITASIEKRGTFIELVREIAKHLNIPFTVGGGVRNADDVARLLDAGADKISINTAAVNHPEMIEKLAGRFGSQCIVIAIDTKHTENGDFVYINGGRTPTNQTTQAWARQVVELGAGEILLTSMDHDGTKRGFALEITRELAENLPIPVIASGGAGTMEHFWEVFKIGKADAALAASVFHFGEIPIPELKKFLKSNGIEVRL
ncbi:MAG: imidazole glycerol phosphate synthase subunit HisF [Candidatus Marinimicrobia bacterium]|jgi:cyclase|nr:imidazole glycerol phosphate synthase subunit HisF [Candidatus Neomarinimicrobiota bacterium]OQC47625.1 MAG: Imidazole glycerol phosphate synthase subunit HisF [Candidatus Marinimicrobia bacterium ADurb.Bin030]HNZ36292.1 imidazole glycerol phosphate synthase subunit HisF [Candidatus Neomarinimicrobiota bacterium]HOG75385.1 imidazole glycerol phosphate synthase subunit HisF [Candidatus Neomarinimicrobiota bacterium]HOU17398.1 imidazole glycerol phosphate synthase subunit HisF [Candidatus Neom